jgi:hypothetical protein
LSISISPVLCPQTTCPPPAADHPELKSFVYDFFKALKSRAN